MKRSTPPLASRLLHSSVVRWVGVFLLAVLVGGCLLPQDDDVLPLLPPKKNRPPRLLITTLEPTQVTSSGNGPNCLPLEFRASVEDPDIADLIAVKWYVDPAGLGSDPVKKEQGLRIDGKTIRDDQARLSLQVTGAGELATVGRHVVEILVSDGQLIERSPQPRPITLADGGTDLNPTYTDSAFWIVDIRPGDCEP